MTRYVVLGYSSGVPATAINFAVRPFASRTSSVITIAAGTEVVTGLGSRTRASLLCGAAAVAHSLFPYVAPETFVAVTIDTSLRRLPRAGQ